MGNQLDIRNERKGEDEDNFKVLKWKKVVNTSNKDKNCMVYVVMGKGVIKHLVAIC